MPKKPLNQHVMTREFRNGLISVYENALGDIGVEPSQVKAHIIGAVTITVTDEQLASIRENAENFLTGYFELSSHSNSGNIKIVAHCGIEFLQHNRPTLTAEQRQKSGGSGRTIDREKAAERKRREEELRAQLIDLHSIDLDAPNPDLIEDDSDTE